MCHEGELLACDPIGLEGLCSTMREYVTCSHVKEHQHGEHARSIDHTHTRVYLHANGLEPSQHSLGGPGVTNEKGGLGRGRVCAGGGGVLASSTYPSMLSESTTTVLCRCVRARVCE